MPRPVLLLCLIFLSFNLSAEPRWWMEEPIRLIQTNLRETDSVLNPVELIEQVEAFGANTLLFSIGGIVAHYPTQVPLHYPSEFLVEGKDVVGEVIREAHNRGIRVIGRFDFSRARQQVYDAHPEWFFKNREGNPVVDDNGLHSSCINGGYYHQKAIEVLTEALERYEVDGLFFNWFGNIRSDYKGNDIGLCHCEECAKRFRAAYGRSIPDEPDPEYNQFMFDSSSEVARMFRELIKDKRPKALFMTYIEQYTDGIVSESDFYKWRPLPQWLYSSSENVNRALNTEPDKMTFNLVMPYTEMRYRFAATSGHGLNALLYQNVAHGGFPAFVVLGTFDQPDRTGLNAVQPFFAWHKKNEALLTGQKNAARVLLYARQGPNWSSYNRDYRGFFRLLSELHIPFFVTNRLDGLSPEEVDLVVVPGGEVPSEIQAFIERGGRALIAGTRHPGMNLPPAVRLWRDTKSSYMRIDNHDAFPSLLETWALFWEGEYLELESTADQPITLIPPGQFGPPDKVSTLAEKTDKPGLIRQSFGAGKFTFIPWNIGRLYHDFSSDKHRLLISDLLDVLLEGKRQLKTNAHPLVEMTLMRQPSTGETLLHLVNLSGHSGTAFFEPVPQTEVSITVKGSFESARPLRESQVLGLSVDSGFTSLVLSSLKDYEVIVLD
ncbi:MAG: beta-galactosidase [Acidobacteriota bacterium]|nr:MAG: beta-galactosidase [Acidobacteriota bacterium]